MFLGCLVWCAGTQRHPKSCSFCSPTRKKVFLLLGLNEKRRGLSHLERKDSNLSASDPVFLLVHLLPPSLFLPHLKKLQQLSVAGVS